MHFQRFATFNKRLLRAQHQRLASIRNLNHQHEIKYHKHFNNENLQSKESKNTENKILKSTNQAERDQTGFKILASTVIGTSTVGLIFVVPEIGFPLFYSMGVSAYIYFGIMSR